ncbi:baculoviral IAP repeat-containing protein [Aspergillus clavatus NRRL 1]|uniref:Chromosome segregation protein BIR1, putative n=1 Tax=Aspergillus clavatus (strain ATCC 1007 / CBS 513.65 / DSM 816 / NCTC 3887 / NRRL 1 / QM 1276 / 107) TaxID=344612 RepID=A1CP55_ASPCL|nr:chromosome segregation protein BIR1, putative [Aspergillus clavatus NRRL 1]EAW07426.1 chromosome segregation protein BIR1, putative [Aspergillus clavatus NRRL 1]
MIHEMETFAARLASFDLVLHPERRRTSSAKAVKPISWPHSRPSPADLAHAGFYYNPYETNPDNTTCYLCQRALDGWEAEDNPVTEHLKHSQDCGWAIMMDIEQHSSNPAEIEDPTSDNIARARQATFGEQWPHDGKRGWVCQSEKMVEGGWYFCPTEESNDLASCAYCKLSLDGWEPKDDPYDEHYRRSADCSFFVFAQPPGKKSKGSRSKKSRVSKASSRLSTQSTVSEAPTVGLDDPMDGDEIPQPVAKTKTTKKSSKSKSKSAKSKKDDAVDVDSQMDVDPAEYVEPEQPKSKRAIRGKKRTSEEMDRDESNIVIPETDRHSEPPAKERATKSRNSTAQREESVQRDTTPTGEREEDDRISREEESKKGRTTTKKKTSSKARKVSETSSLAKAALETHVSQDSEIDAVIEPNLDRVEAMTEAAPAETQPLPKKSKSRKKAKKTVEESPKASYDAVDQSMEQPVPSDDDEFVYKRSIEAEIPLEKPNSTKSTTKSKSLKETRESEDKVSEQPKRRSKSRNDTADDEPDRRHESFLSVEITTRNTGLDVKDQPTDDEPQVKKAKKKSSTGKTKKTSQVEDSNSSKGESRASERSETRNSLKKQTSPQPDEPVPEQLIEQDAQELEHQPEQEIESEQEQEPDFAPSPSPEREPQPEHTPDLSQSSARRRSSKVPPKTVERFSDISQDKQFAKSIAETRTPNSNKTPRTGVHVGIQRNDTVSPLPSTSKSTPSLSPQSSDAENKPPTVNRSVARAPLSSPSKEKAVRIPLAASTPSPSKRNANTGLLKSVHPWTPVNIDEVLYASMSDKENTDVGAGLNILKGDLTSPERKMTVEEWIFWNAKNGEEKLKRECERLVTQFEKEGARAMHALEGIECID